MFLDVTEWCVKKKKKRKGSESIEPKHNESPVYRHVSLEAYLLVIIAAVYSSVRELHSEKSKANIISQNKSTEIHFTAL